MSDLRVLKSLLVSCAACFTPEGSASKKKKRNFQILGKLENLSCLSVLNAPSYGLYLGERKRPISLRSSCMEYAVYGCHLQVLRLR